MNWISYLSVSSQFIFPVHTAAIQEFYDGTKSLPSNHLRSWLHSGLGWWIGLGFWCFRTYRHRLVCVSWKRRFVDAIPLSYIYISIPLFGFYIYLSIYIYIYTIIYHHHCGDDSSPETFWECANIGKNIPSSFKENHDEPSKWWVSSGYVKIAIEDGHRNSEFSH